MSINRLQPLKLKLKPRPPPKRRLNLFVTAGVALLIGAAALFVNWLFL